MGLESNLAELIAEELVQKYAVAIKAIDINLQPTKKEFEGVYTFVTFPYAGRLKMKPEEVGEAIGTAVLEKSDVICGYNVVKGFLNFEVSASYWSEVLFDFDSEKIGCNKQEDVKRVMVEYSSPNTNKPLHLGHLRNNFLGYSISQILRANGANVTMANLINDRGIHICKSMIAYQKFGHGETPKSENIKGDHLVGKYYVIFDQAYKKEIEGLVAEGVDKEDAKKVAPLMLETQEMLRKWEKGDNEVRALWKQMNEWVYEGFNHTYDLIGVNFDQFYYESDTYLLGKDLVEEGLEKKAFFKKEDGSVWADLTTEGLDEKLVLRGDGTSVYMTQDMGTADLKYEDYNVDQSIYVVGNEQDYHFVVLKKILKKLERPYADGIYHMSYGMVDLPSGKMKSREGTVVDADDLVQEMIDTAKQRTNEQGKIDGFEEQEANQLYRMLALGALKYFILKVDPKKQMLFNPEESIDFQGNTGPFIQYTHARIKAILRKAKEDKIAYETKLLDYSCSDLEGEIIYLLTQFNQKIMLAAKDYSPSVIAAYCFDVAKAYNRFYAESPIFKATEEEKCFRVNLSGRVAEVIKKGMGMLGIEVPERM